MGYQIIMSSVATTTFTQCILLKKKKKTGVKKGVNASKLETFCSFLLDWRQICTQKLHERSDVSVRFFGTQEHTVQSISIEVFSKTAKW